MCIWALMSVSPNKSSVQIRQCTPFLWGSPFLPVRKWMSSGSGTILPQDTHHITHTAPRTCWRQCPCPVEWNKTGPMSNQYWTCLKVKLSPKCNLGFFFCECEWVKPLHKSTITTEEALLRSKSFSMYTNNVLSARVQIISGHIWNFPQKWQKHVPLWRLYGFSF